MGNRWAQAIGAVVRLTTSRGGTTISVGEGPPAPASARLTASASAAEARARESWATVVSATLLSPAMWLSSYRRDSSSDGRLPGSPDVVHRFAVSHC